MNSEYDPPDVFGLSKLRDYFFQKVFLSSDPSTGSYIVVLIHNTQYRLSFATAGDDCWTPLPPHKYFADCVFKDDLMYALTQFGEIFAFHFSGPSIKQNVVLEKMKSYTTDEAMHIVQTPCGDLLQIWWDSKHLRMGKDISQPQLNYVRLEEEDDVSEPETGSETESESYTSQPELNSLEEDGNFSESERVFEPSRFYSILSKVYRVDLTSNKPVEISSLGEDVLFLGQNQSLCLHAQDHPQLKANHIYITDLDPYIPVEGENDERDIGVLNLGNNSREEIVCPQLWSNWPSPMWITPNPRKATLRPGRNAEGIRESVVPTALPEVASCCTVGDNPTDGKTSLRSKVDVKTQNCFFVLIAIFIFGLLGKVRSVCCLIAKKASIYREG